MADDFDIKYKRQQVGITDKKTGKTIPPFDKATQTAKRLAKASTIGKAVAIPIALGAAAFEYAKGKRKEKKESPMVDTDKSMMQGVQDVEGMAEGGSVRGQKAIQVKKKPFKGIF
jgi:hypothetical protein